MALQICKAIYEFKKMKQTKFLGIYTKVIRYFNFYNLLILWYYI